MKRKVAILGGGLASLSTAFELTRRPGWRDHFEITVYQMGHRLGGKGASSCNEDAFDRVEEHGLHVFWGFYDNAFRMLRETFDELGRPKASPMATLEDAFKPQDLIVVPEKVGEAWDFWTLEAPRNRGVPGDGTEAADLPETYLPQLLHYAGRLFEGLSAPSTSSAALRARLGGELPALTRLLEAVDRSIGDKRSAAVAAFDTAFMAIARGAAISSIGSSRMFGGAAVARLGLELAEMIAERRATGGNEDSARDARAILFLLDHSVRGFVQLVERGDRGRRLRTQIDFMLAFARGIVADGLLLRPRDWFRLDDETFRDWLTRHGAAPETTASAFLEGMHAALYMAGLELGAGTAVHGLLRMLFTYKGSLLYKMRAGMGETVVAPLYQVLARRGVRFEFFHAVSHLELSEDKRRVARVVIDRQATVKGGRYQPLVDVAGLPCWPSRPRYEQLEEGERLRAEGEDLEGWWGRWTPVERVELEHGRDFDALVLGISIGAFRDVCKELIADEGNPRFGAMVEHVKTTQTQSAQLWFGPDLERLGWKGADPIVIPYAEPIDTWADMSHLLAREARTPATSADGLVYLTARMEDDEPVPPRGPSEYPARQKARVKANVERWLTRSAGGLWPRAVSRHDPSALNFHLLVDPEDRDGVARLDAQYFAGIPSPSDRYVMTLAGTTKFRLRPHQSGYENLVLAGDWTLTSINGGCVEAAVMSGLDAARAIDAGVRPGIGDWLGAFERGTRALDAGERAARSELVRRNASSPPAAPSSANLASAGVASKPRRELPRYVVRDGELAAVPPIALDIDMHMFVLRADPGRLATLLDEQLNHGGPTVYRPLSPVAVLYCSRVGNYPVVDPFGWVPELDFGIWVPAIAGEVKRGVFHPKRVVTFTPYIWVNSDVAMSNGRSFFGFTKDLGELSMPTRPDDPSPFKVATHVMPKFAADAPVEMRPIIEVRRVSDSAPRALTTAWRSGVEMAKAFADTVSSLRGEGMARGAELDFLRTLLRDAPRGQRMVFLKQFPDVADGRRACYQAVVEADIRITSPVTGGPMGGDWDVTIETYDSHRIVDTLGLATVRRDGHTSLCRPISQGSAAFTASVDLGQVVWEA